MMNRRKVGILGVIGLSAAIMAGTATSVLADTQKPLPKAHNAAPTTEQIADSMASDMAKKLNLNAATEKKVAHLFKTDGQDIRQLQMKLSEKRHELNSLSPNDKGYMKKVDKLASESGNITEKLTIEYAKSRADLYALLTPKQIKILENYGKQAPNSAKQS
ncbi:hypothetical protein DFP81_11253 [Marinomonas pollencensis]|uniref:Spy/CpxP family protein refolding chaperone n=2 Tax=Marinomonas pollencensis TaxID=491954 RepID=A0A3E0DJ04_9GAMM|nr:hypothetical protein DFP81_11253 [Marinomonas pollencensis]